MSEQVYEWAYAAADTGRHQDALSWLRALQAVDGRLPADLRYLYHQCTSAVRERAVIHSARRGHTAGSRAVWTR